MFSSKDLKNFRYHQTLGAFCDFENVITPRPDQREYAFWFFPWVPQKDLPDALADVVFTMNLFHEAPNPLRIGRLERNLEVDFSIQYSDYLSNHFLQVRNHDPWTAPSSNWGSKLPDPRFATSASMLVENRYCYHADHVNPNPNYQYNGHNINLCLWRPFVDGFKYPIKFALFRIKMSLAQKYASEHRMCINNFLCTQEDVHGLKPCKLPAQEYEYMEVDMDPILEVRECLKGQVELLQYKKVWLGTLDHVQRQANVLLRTTPNKVVNYESQARESIELLIVELPTQRYFNKFYPELYQLLTDEGRYHDNLAIGTMKVSCTQLMHDV